MSLKSKPVIAVVLALLAVVVVVNVMVFKPGQGAKQRTEVRVQSAQPLPVDLEDFRYQSTASHENLAAWSSAATPALKRDPFGRRRVEKPANEPVAEIAVEDSVTINALVCDAVLMGGAYPAAVINGKSYRVGEFVRDYEVAAIGSLGTKLIHVSGESLFLSVDSDRGPVGRSRIVTESNMMGGLGQTSLVEHARGERK